MFTLKQLILFLILGLFIAISYKLFPRLKGRYIRYIEESKVMDTKAPSRELKTMNGIRWRLDSHLGKKIIIVFWAKNCSYCIKEIPNVEKFYNRYKDNKNLEIVSYSRDLSMDVSKLKKFVIDRNITYPVLVEPNLVEKEDSFLREFKVFGLPSIWVIDEKGNMIAGNLRNIDEVAEFI